jgi:hypothetical protein
VVAGRGFGGDAQEVVAFTQSDVGELEGIAVRAVAVGVFRELDLAAEPDAHLLGVQAGVDTTTDIDTRLLRDHSFVRAVDHDDPVRGNVPQRVERHRGIDARVDDERAVRLPFR